MRNTFWAKHIGCQIFLLMFRFEKLLAQDSICVVTSQAGRAALLLTNNLVLTATFHSYASCLCNITI